MKTSIHENMTVKEWLDYTKSAHSVSRQSLEGAQAQLRPDEEAVYACGGFSEHGLNRGILVITFSRVFVFMRTLAVHFFKEIAIDDILTVEEVDGTARIKSLVSYIEFTPWGKNTSNGVVHSVINQVIEQVKAGKEPPEPADPPAAGSVADELLKWKQLLDEGVVTPEEFERQKHKLLNS